MRSPDWQSPAGDIRLYLGDCRDVLPLEVPVETCITDPPYELTTIGRTFQATSGSIDNRNGLPRSNRRPSSGGFMGKSWDATGVPFEPATWAKVLASLLPGASLLAFGGTRTYHRMTCAIEDAGFEIRDCLAWLYGQGFPKSLDISKAMDKAAGAEREVVATADRKSQPMNGAAYGGDRDSSDLPAITAPATDAAKLWNGWGTALKPAFEPIVLAMVPLDGTFAENAQRHGVAGLNVDGARVGSEGWTKKDGEAGAGFKTGKYLVGNLGRGEPTQQNGVRQSTSGRWPANVILDAEAGAILDEQSGDLHNAGASRDATRSAPPKGMFNLAGGDGHRFGDDGGASRFFYCAKADSDDRRGSRHPTVKPVDLLTWLCKLTATPTGGTVLDPFMGTGTTMEAAFEQHRPFVGIELEPANFADAVKRAEAITGRYGLFGG